MKETISIITDACLDIIEARMNEQQKGVIRTKTLKKMILGRKGVEIKDNNPISEYLKKIGLGQVIEQRLKARDYRSVRKGLFVNLEKCSNLHFLNALLKNEELLIKDKEAVKRRINKVIKKKTDPQGYLDLSSPNLSVDSVKYNITEEELLAELEANAI